MDFAEMAMAAQMRGENEKSLELFRQALAFEIQAAETLRDQLDIEPTRSILYRSAASLAIDCKDYRQAEKLVAIKLTGDPPIEIADELRDVLKQTFFLHRLEVKGLELTANDLTLSIAGEDTGLGIAPSDIVLDRLSTFKTLAERTAERKANQPYRSAGQSRTSSKYPMFLKAFSPGSFVVTVTIGHPRQMALPTFEELDPAVDIVKEILDCIELLNRREENALRQRIPDPAYFNNFVSLMNKIAPDGESVQRVGFSSIQNGVERTVPLLRRQAEISNIPKLSSGEGEEWGSGEKREIQGILRFADAVKDEKAGFIKLVPEEGKPVRIKVPQGMDDIVGPLWSQQVVAIVVKHENIYFLEDIRRAD